MTTPEDLAALRADERASLLRVLDWGVERQAMTHKTALSVLGIADSLPDLLDLAARATSAEAALAAVEKVVSGWEAGGPHGTSCRHAAALRAALDQAVTG